MARASKKVFLQVLWTGVDSSCPSLFLFTDTKRYIFNCSEGIQRLFTQCRIKIGKLDTFFLTRYQWSHMGGLPGFGMTLRDVKSHLIAEREQLKNKETLKNTKKVNTQHLNQQSSGVINVHSPRGMQRVLNASKHFMRFDTSGVSFNVIEHGHFCQSCNDVYKDDEMIVHPIPLYNDSSCASRQQYYSSYGNIDDINVSPRFSPPSLCYACHLHPVPGKFLVEKAKELRIPRGPLYSKLTKGETVILEDGRKITPDQVVEPALPGPIFLIIDCPSSSYISNLIKNEKLQSYMLKDQSPQVIYHLTKKYICDDDLYQSWISRFPSSVQHIFLDNLQQKRIVFQSQYNVQTILNRIHPHVFPLIEQQKATKMENREENATSVNFTKYNLRETFNGFKSSIDNTDVFGDKHDQDLFKKREELFNSIASETTTDSAKKLSDESLGENEGKCININGKRLLNDSLYYPKCKKVELDRSFPQVICFGTGAAIPSKNRNVSATLVLLSGEDAVLFDCGEDTYGQLTRHYGDKLNNILLKIKFILISHMHADHHLGLITLLQKLNTLQKEETVHVVAPGRFSSWLTQYAEVSETLKFKFTACQNILDNAVFHDDIQVKAVKVDHPGSAHGFVVCNHNFKITYSGDTMPCENLITAGEDSTLLIHEATLNDDMPEEALARKHSTITQALDVADKMKAKYVLLTHFSQRYPKMPDLKNTTLARHTAFAFDHMEVSLDDIPEFYDLIPKLKLLFTVENEE